MVWKTATHVPIETGIRNRSKLPCDGQHASFIKPGRLIPVRHGQQQASDPFTSDGHSTGSSRQEWRPQLAVKASDLLTLGGQKTTFLKTGTEIP